MDSPITAETKIDAADDYDDMQDRIDALEQDNARLRGLMSEWVRLCDVVRDVYAEAEKYGDVIDPEDHPIIQQCIDAAAAIRAAVAEKENGNG